MIVSDLILHSAGFVGYPTEHGGFALAGSGFFVFYEEDEYAFNYFLTAQHVVNPTWRRRDAPFPPAGDMTIRINRKNGEPPYTLKTHKADWLFPEDRRSLDVCAYAIDSEALDPDDNWEVGWLNLRSLSATSPIRGNEGIPIIPLYLGDEVFIVGAFSPRLGERRNIPVVRKGSIAALLDEPIERASPKHSAYLIETRSLGGVSGAPIFFDLAARTGGSGRVSGPVVTTNTETGRSSPPTLIMPYKLVGMVLGTWDSGAEDFISIGESETKSSDYMMNSGISVAMSVAQILDFIKSPSLKEQRLKAVEHREKQSRYRIVSTGFRPSEANQAAPDADATPNSREDLTQLLGAASRKKPQAD